MISKMEDAMKVINGPKSISFTAAAFAQSVQSVRTQRGDLWLQQRWEAALLEDDYFQIPGVPDQNVVSHVYRDFKVRRPATEPVALIQKIRADFPLEGSNAARRSPQTGIGRWGAVLQSVDFDLLTRTPAIELVWKAFQLQGPPLGVNLSIRSAAEFLEKAETNDPQSEYIFLDLSNIQQAELNMLACFGLHICDISGRHASQVIAVAGAAPGMTPPVMQALCDSVSEQDIDLALFFLALPLRDQGAEWTIEIPAYNRVDHLASYFDSNRKGFNSLTNHTSRGLLFQYYRVCKTYWIQEAKIAIGGNYMDWYDNFFPAEAVEFAATYINLRIKPLAPAGRYWTQLWIPYEVINAMGGSVTIDQSKRVIGCDGQQVAIECRHPPSVYSPESKYDSYYNIFHTNAQHPGRPNNGGRYQCLNPLWVGACIPESIVVNRDREGGVATLQRIDWSDRLANPDVVAGTAWVRPSFRSSH